MVDAGRDGLRVLVVDDHSLIRESMGALFRSAGMHVVGEFEDGESAVARAAACEADVAVVDITLEHGDGRGIDGLEVIRSLRALTHRPAVLVVSAVRDPAVMQRAYELGAAAYLQKLTANGELLVNAVRAVAQGTKLGDVALYHPPSAGAAPADPVSSPVANLTDREREVLGYVGLGNDNLKIANCLGISERTVRAHMSALYRKLQKENRTELALVGRDFGVRPK